MQTYDIYNITTRLYLHTINNSQMYNRTFIEYSLFTIYTAATTIYAQNISDVVHWYANIRYLQEVDLFDTIKPSSGFLGGHTLKSSPHRPECTACH